MIFRLFLGGSFDPVHDGHMAMICQVTHRLSALSLDFEVSFLPTAGNPFKGNPTDSAHRLAMLDLACQSLMMQGVQANICLLEIHQTPPVYTIDTVQKMHNLYPNDVLIFVMGHDSLASLPKWKNYEQILDFVKIWSFARADNTQPILPEILVKTTRDFEEFLESGMIFYDPTPIPAVSSSQIRQDLADGNALAHLPEVILTYIKQHQLYQTVV